MRNNSKGNGLNNNQPFVRAGYWGDYKSPKTLYAAHKLNGGEEEIRTLDPHVANVMLYQLSYFPMC